MDIRRKRIALTMRLDDVAGERPGASRSSAPARSKPAQSVTSQDTAMSAAFARLKK